MPNYNTNKPFVLQWHSETTKVHNPFRYAGEYADEETNLIYLRNRYYDPSIGRFISEDPVRDGNNWYVYCGNNPISFVNPFGMKDVPIRSLAESLGATVSWNGEDRTFTINMGEIGSKTYSISKNGSKPKPEDSYSSSVPYYKWTTEGNLQVYMDENDFYSDFGIVDAENVYSDELKDNVAFVLVKKSNLYYQRMTIGNKQIEYTQVKYKNFKESFDLIKGVKRYSITSRNVNKDDIYYVNKKYWDDINDMVFVLENDPSLGNLNDLGSILGFFTSNLHSENIISYSDVVIHFRKTTYYIEPKTLSIKHKS